MVVEQKMMNTEMMMKAASCWSRSTKEMAAPMLHMMTTLYTLMPTYLESFSAGMLTWRVSHARKQPNACIREDTNGIIFDPDYHELVICLEAKSAVDDAVLRYG